MFHYRFWAGAFACAVLVFINSMNAAAANNEDVGSHAFKPAASKTMALKYGSRGAAVFDNSLKKWVFWKITSAITHPKAEGLVNQVNDNFVLAAGKNEVAIYDYSKHKWFVRERTTPNDKTGNLKDNFVLTNDYAEVALINSSTIRYTSDGGWAEKPKRF